MRRRYQIALALVALTCLCGSRTADCRFSVASQAGRDKSAELELAKEQFLSLPERVPRKSTAGKQLEGLAESIARRKELEEERSSSLDAAYKSQMSAAMGDIRRLLTLSMSRRERLQGRTKQMAREQRWAKAKKDKLSGKGSKDKENIGDKNMRQSKSGSFDPSSNGKGRREPRPKQALSKKGA